MSGRKLTDIEDLTATLSAEFTKYAKATADEVKEAAAAAAKYGVNEVRKNIAEQGIGHGAKGDYAKSWKSKKIEESATSVTYSIYSTQPGLPHLLEKGHVIRNQTGKVYGKTRPRPHIAPAERAAEEYFERLIKKEVGP